MKGMIFVIFCSVILSGCISGMENPFSKYLVVSPIMFDMITQEDIDSGFEVVIKTPDDTVVPIYFNGQNVTSCFTWSGVIASSDITCMSDYIRQDRNTISVNPQSLFGGTTRYFTMDTEGPSVSIKTVCYLASGDCTLSNTGDVAITVQYIDPSEVLSTTVNGITPHAENGTVRTYIIGVSDKYTFDSVDSLGYTSTHYFKSEGQRLDEIVNVRIDETMLGALIPLINEGASAKEFGALDKSDPIMEGVEAQILGLSNMLITVHYMKVGSFKIKEISINDSNADLETRMTMEPLGTNWVNNNDIVETPSDVGVEVFMTMQDVLWCYDPLGWIPACQPCAHSAFDMCQNGLIKTDMHMFIEKMNVNARVNDDIVTNGNFHIKLEKLASGQDVLVMKDTCADNCVAGEPADEGIMGWLISSSILRGMILTIVEDTVNRNLNEIELGSNFKFDSGSEAELSVRVDTLTTDIGSGDNIGNMNIGLSGIFDTIVPDPTIAPALGSYHIEDDPLPSTEDDGSAMAVVLNSNAVNQAFLAMYNTGATHLTLLNGEVHTGLGVTDDLGKAGDLRIEMNPSSPGGFHLAQGTTNNLAFLSFRGAEAIVAAKQSDGTWSKVTRIDMDIKAGVMMGVEGGYLKMTIANTPEFTINHMDDINYKGQNLAFFLNHGFIEKLLEVSLEWLIPYVADSRLTIDVGKLGIDKLYTDKVDTKSGHLHFQNGISQ